MSENLKLFLLIAALLFPNLIFSQGTVDDYKRANALWGKISDKVYHVPHNITWTETGDFLSYTVLLPNKERQLKIVDPEKKEKSEIAISEIANQMSDILSHKVELTNFARYDLHILNANEFEFTVYNKRWKWNEKENKLSVIGDAKREEPNKRNYYDNSGESVSPDGKWVALIKNQNIYVRERNKVDSERQLTFDGNPGEFYESYIQWSKDSRKIAAVRKQNIQIRQLTLVESSPSQQLQPKLHHLNYAKPGDALAQRFPVVIDVEDGIIREVDKSQIANQYELKNISWYSDDSGIIFEYNQRGHQRYDVIALDAHSGETKTIISERSKTFIDYSGKLKRNYLKDSFEIIWSSERDGWNHLYLYDSKTGELKNQITKGDWVFRNIVHVDEKNRKIIFEASGKNRKEDPYFVHLYTVDFDGKNLKELTPESAQHQAYFNRDYSMFVDLFSRVDQAPQAVLRDASGKLIMSLESADISDLEAIGWRKPEVFSAKGRDGKTDIWGIIIRPSNYDENKTYPVIENIYAGPHSSFVPKSFQLNPSGMYELAELGFIVVQIDGMGTSNRSKAFHDVCWQNLKDAGFPDRIKWMEAAAKKYPQMDLSKVGIYGTSAGGQSSTGALLFFPEFYKVAVSSCGCHDNRMDKIWWNEQWMGWPIGPHYSESSNVDNAYLLEGKLMLIVGEMDDNVDPSSTYQVVNQLVKHNKDHEFIMVPGLGHSSGGDYGEKKRRDFFVKHLLNVEPPKWSEY